jgi:hypothetical protein
MINRISYSTIDLYFSIFCFGLLCLTNRASVLAEVDSIRYLALKAVLIYQLCVPSAAKLTLKFEL